MNTPHIRIAAILSVCLLTIFVTVSPVHASIEDERANQIQQIEEEAEELSSDSRANDCPSLSSLATTYGFARNEAEEQTLGRSLLDLVYDEYRYQWESIANQECSYDSLIFYVTYNFGTTSHLGAGERAGALNSWRSAQRAMAEGVFIPWSEHTWQDILKIGNGRWPTYIQNDQYEQDIADKFREVYLRDPDRSNPHDDAAIVIMAYGLRPRPRNLDSEATAIGFYKSIYGSDPSSAGDWDTVRAIAYSGATR